MLSEWILDHPIHLESPWFFLLFPVIIISCLIGLRRKKPSVIVTTIQPYRKSISARQTFLSLVNWPIFLEGIGLFCLMIALIRPQYGIEETIRRTEGIDIMLALDISGSMQAFDVSANVKDQRTVVKHLKSGKLKSRIDVAIDEVKHFIDRRPNDRIGLVAFAANTYTVCPPTLDHPFLKNNLDRLEAGMLTDGTGIAAPIAISTNRLKDSTAKRRVLVLFTDGDNNVDVKVTPLQAADIADSYDVIIHTVGIGSNRAFVVRPDFFGRQQLVGVQGSFNQDLLKDIAGKTDGDYFAAADAKGFKSVMKAIDGLEKTNMEQPTYIDYKDLYRIWLLAGVAFLGVAFFLEHSFALKIP